MSDFKERTVACFNGFVKKVRSFNNGLVASIWFYEGKIVFSSYNNRPPNIDLYETNKHLVPVDIRRMIEKEINAYNYANSTMSV